MLSSLLILQKLLVYSMSASRLTKDDSRVRTAQLPLECVSECGQIFLVNFILSSTKDSRAALTSSLHCALAAKEIECPQ